MLNFSKQTYSRGNSAPPPPPTSLLHTILILKFSILVPLSTTYMFFTCFFGQIVSKMLLKNDLSPFFFFLKVIIDSLYYIITMVFRLDGCWFLFADQR